MARDGIASGNQFFEPQLFKVVRKIVKEIAHSRIVAVTIDHLALEMFLIMF